MVSKPSLHVSAVYAPVPRETLELLLELPGTATVADCLRATGWIEKFPQWANAPPDVGVWGRKVSLNHRLREGDRVEVYRPLTVDPKVARRERFVRQGAKTAGLFTKVRAGGKAGY